MEDTIMNYVDLGLPSGTLWATCNVGANKPEEYGVYYNFDDAQELGVELPTEKQIEELIGHTKSEWCEVNGVSGRRFIGPNGNSIFLPAAGFYDGDILIDDGSNGLYWSSSLVMEILDNARFLYFSSRNVFRDYCNLYYGQSVRPVKNKQ